MSSSSVNATSDTSDARDDAKREATLDTAVRVRQTGVVTHADAVLLAESLLEIAEIAMPDSYFACDSRCDLARAVRSSSAVR